MEFLKILNFARKNLEYFDMDDVENIGNANYISFLNKFNQKYQYIEDEEFLDKYEEIIEFFQEFIDNFQAELEDFNQEEEKDIDYYIELFDFYLDKWFFEEASNLLGYISQQLEEVEEIEDLLSRYEKAKDKFKVNFNDIKSRVWKRDATERLENYMETGSYGQAMAECIDYIQNYDDEHRIYSYISELNEIRKEGFLESIAQNRWKFSKIQANDILSKSELEEEDIEEIFDRLKQVKKYWFFEDWISFINFLIEKFQITEEEDLYDDLLKFKDKFVSERERQEKKKQQHDYSLELKSLKLLTKNKQYHYGLLKATNILKKYPLVDKKEVFSQIKELKKVRKTVEYQKWKQTFQEKVDEFFIRLSSLNKRWLIQFYHKMAWFLGANMDLRVTLQVIYSQTKDYAIKSFLRDLINWVDSWMKISDIMEYYKPVSKVDVALIRIWESTWKLWEMFTTISNNKREEQDRKKKIRSVMMYPTIVIIITIAIFIGLLVFILPRFMQLFDQVGMDMPLITQIFMNISYFIQDYWHFLVLWIILTVFAVAYFLRFEPGKYISSYLALRFPIVKQIVNKNYIIFFSKNLGIMLKSWINLLDALDIISEGADNRFFGNEFKRIRFELETWITFSKAIWLWSVNEMANYNNEYIPVDIAYTIDIWERTWQLADMLEETSNRYDYDLRIMINNLQNLMEPFIIILVWGVVFLFVLAVFLPLMQMYQAIWSL